MLLPHPTPRLVLRSWRDEDLPAFAAMNADPRVMEFFPEPLDETRSAEFFNSIRTEFAVEGFGPYAVERREDGALIGLTGLHRVTFRGELQGSVEIGWRLCTEAWGRGYATEAARSCLLHASELGIERIIAFTAIVNLRSQRVMQRLGMEYAGEFDHPELPSGHPLQRHVLYETGLCNDLLDGMER